MGRKKAGRPAGAGKEATRPALRSDPSGPSRRCREGRRVRTADAPGVQAGAGAEQRRVAAAAGMPATGHARLFPGGPVCPARGERRSGLCACAGRGGGVSAGQVIRAAGTGCTNAGGGFFRTERGGARLRAGRFPWYAPGRRSGGEGKPAAGARACPSPGVSAGMTCCYLAAVRLSCPSQTLSALGRVGKSFSQGLLSSTEGSCCSLRLNSRMGGTMVLISPARAALMR